MAQRNLFALPLLMGHVAPQQFEEWQRGDRTVAEQLFWVPSSEYAWYLPPLDRTPQGYDVDNIEQTPGGYAYIMKGYSFQRAKRWQKEYGRWRHKPLGEAVDVRDVVIPLERVELRKCPNAQMTPTCFGSVTNTPCNRFGSMMRE